jgi:hypothetical protein
VHSHLSHSTQKHIQVQKPIAAAALSEAHSYNRDSTVAAELSAQKLVTAGIQALNANTCIDASIRTLFKQVLPDSRGLTILIRLLGYAQLDWRPRSNMLASATISTSDLKTLAQQIHLNKDTLLRYLDIFYALGLLHKQRSNPQKQTILHFQLTEYQVQRQFTLNELDHIIATKRCRLRQFAANVKVRYQTAYLEQQPALEHAETNTAENSLSMLHQGITVFLHNMQNERCASEQLHLIMKNASVLRNQIQAYNNPSHADPASLHADLPLPPHLSRADPASHHADLPLPLHPSHADLASSLHPSHADLSAHRADLALPAQAQEDDLPAHHADLESSVQSLSINDNDNIILYNNINKTNKTILNVIDTTTVSDQKTAIAEDGQSTDANAQSRSGEQTAYNGQEYQVEATALANFLDGNVKNVGSYINRFRENPRAVRASVISVLLRCHYPDYRGKPRNMGAFFNVEFKKFAHPNANIPQEIAHWLNTELTWSEIDAQLKEEAARQPPVQSGTYQQARRQATASSNTHTHKYQRQTGPYPASNSQQRRTTSGMSQEQAAQLTQQIQADCHEHHCAATTKIEERRGSLVVIARLDTRAYINRYTDVPINNHEHWQHYFTDTLVPTLQRMNTKTIGEKRYA